MTQTPALRPRLDGWTAERRSAFIDALAETGSVRHACEAVGMTHSSAYRLRLRADMEEFRDAWTMALQCSFESLHQSALQRCVTGVEVPIFYRGERVGEKRFYDGRVTVFLLATRQRQLDEAQRVAVRLDGEVRRVPADAVPHIHAAAHADHDVAWGLDDFDDPEPDAMPDDAPGAAYDAGTAPGDGSAAALTGGTHAWEELDLEAAAAAGARWYANNPLPEEEPERTPFTPYVDTSDTSVAHAVGSSPISASRARDDSAPVNTCPSHPHASAAATFSARSSTNSALARPQSEPAARDVVDARVRLHHPFLARHHHGPEVAEDGECRLGHRPELGGEVGDRVQRHTGRHQLVDQRCHPRHRPRDGLQPARAEGGDQRAMFRVPRRQLGRSRGERPPGVVLEMPR